MPNVFNSKIANNDGYSYIRFGWTSIPSKDPDRGFNKFPITVYHLSFDSPGLGSQKDKIYKNILNSTLKSQIYVFKLSG